MSVADFFQLSAYEAASSQLDVMARLQALLPGETTTAEHKEVAGIVASASAPAAGPAPPPPPSAEPVASPSCAGKHEEPQEQAAAAPTAKATSMPPPPPRAPLAPANPPARMPKGNEIVYSANGSPINLAALSALGPAKPAPSCAAADATPAPGTSYAGAAPSAAPPTVMFTGATFRRATVARGRTKQASRAITVTTADGKQWTVDDVIGMAGVPQKYRDEVRRLVESDLRDLELIVKTATDIEAANAAEAAKPSSALPPPAPVPVPAAAPMTRASRRR
ncbi:hypothetical protein HYH03_016672 [Edaphochlamys debaryana]|uniref:Uncharacterized protein n=1 Tax=Edaphochlamys debaryana TaxID=47281 RepID=A0A835XJX6_9CHLO|nr:hypothetical protein HYH03_016672 [Edaphochlamys debaryana]|eukprot:KAG2484537.1 hypothetical protein HYH03_016672 [Edaphochlamys debaryana]